MKTNINLLKRAAYSSWCILLLLFAISCNKETGIVLPEDNLSPLVAEARIWYEKQKPVVIIEESKNRDSYSYLPNWREASIYRNNRGVEIVAVPFIIDDGQTHIELNIQVLGDIQHGIIKKYTWQKDGSIRLFVSEITGKLIMDGYYLSNTGIYRVMKDYTGVLSKLRLQMTEDPAWYAEIEEVVVTVKGKSDGGAQSVGIPVEQLDPPDNVIIEYSTTISGGGNGYSTSNQSNSSDIHNDLTDPCLKALLNTILNMQFANRVHNILNEFNISSDINLDFVDTAPLDDQIMGYFNGEASVDGRFQIELNRDHLPKSSKEFATAVIIHEAIHAYLSKNAIDINFQHNEMFLKYRKTISDALVQMYGTNQQVADDLAFVGLTVSHDNYSWWDWYLSNIPQNTKNRIMNTLNNHKNGTQGTSFCNR